MASDASFTRYLPKALMLAAEKDIHDIFIVGIIELRNNGSNARIRH
jgi:hypothetical protein